MDRAEQAGLGASLAGHVALFGALALGLATTAGPPPIPDAMEVSFVDEIGLTAAAPEPAAPPAQAAAPVVAAPEDAPPVLAPTPAPPVPQPAPRQAAPAPAPTPPKPAPAPAPRPPGRAGSGARTARPALGADILDGIGRDPSPTHVARPTAAAVSAEARASINQAITRALLPCQRQPLPAPEASAIQVLVRVTLARDGGLAGAEVGRVINDNPNLRIYEQRMRDLALSVVRRCTPIRGLPAELYDVPRGWRQFNYTFDPRLVR
jgi:hypothetical protein